MTAKPGLRRLDFVETYTAASVDKASGIYKALKEQLLPSFAKVQLEKAEGLTNQYAGPYYGKLVSVSQSLLKYADEKVDYSLVAGTQVLQSTSQEIRAIAEPEKLKSHFNSAKATVAANTNKAADFIKAHGLTGTAKYLISEAINSSKKVVKYGLEKSNEGYTYARNTTANAAGYAQQKTQIAADTVIARGQSFVDLATEKSRAAHDAVVKQPLYKDAYERTNYLVAVAQDTKVYKVTVSNLYPLVAPVYNPAYEKIEPYYKSTINYWKPVTAAA